MKKLAAICLVVGFMFGLGANPRGNAATAELSNWQALQIEAAHRSVRNKFAHIGADGHGRCAWITLMDRWAFRRLGVPDDAMIDVTYRAPRGWTDPIHRVLVLNARVNGRPWQPIFDMNYAAPRYGNPT